METMQSIRRSGFKIEKVASIAHLSLPVGFVTLVGYVAAVCHHIH